MSISKSAHLTAITPQFVRKLTLRIAHRWLFVAACVLLILVFTSLLVLRQSDPLNDLEAAKARWAASGITDYRITVEFQYPYSSCKKDFEVRGSSISYKYKDTCRFGGAITPNRNNDWPTIDVLFSRIEDSLKNPQCGPNGCVCDGPIELGAVYDPERGYPQQITSTLRQDLRSRDLQYWLAVLNGSLANCPPVNYIGQTIRITAFEALPPLVEQLTESTPEISIGDAIKPQVTPETTPAQ